MVAIDAPVVLLALGAGILGALSGGFSKFAASYPCTLVARVLLYAPVLACNAGMMTLFTKAMARGTAVSVTAVSTAANILCTGIISAAVFDAALTSKWFIGLLCITLGTVLITAASPKSEETSSHEIPEKED